MSHKKKKLIIFIALPVLLVAVYVVSIFLDQKRTEKRHEEEATTETTLSKEEEIDQMLLEEYQKSQSTREYAVETTEAPQELTPEDNEYDDMIGDAQEDAPNWDGDLSDEDEAIISSAEKSARENNNALYYNGIEVVSSMNQVETNGQWVVSLTPAELAAAHPLFLQYDSRWATYPYGMGTMKSSACGPTCFSMVITALTNITNASPPLVATYSMNHGHYVPGAGTAHTLFLQGCTDFGLYCNEISNDEAQMKAHIDNGEMLILSVHYGNFTHSGSGHFIVIYGYNENGFMVNDPGSYDRSCKYWPYNVFSGDINKIYSLGKL